MSQTYTPEELKEVHLGECGRQWTCVVIDGTRRYFAGCFAGTRERLVQRIEAGKEHYKASRYKGLEVLDALMDMNEQESKP